MAKKKKTAAPEKTVQPWPFEKHVMILYVMCCLGILSATVFSLLTAVLAGDGSGSAVSVDLILLTVSFVSSFLTFLLLSEGRRKQAVPVSLLQLLYGIYRVAREVLAAKEQGAVITAVYLIVQVVYFLLQPCMFTVTVALQGKGQRKDLLPKLCVITSFLLIFLRLTNYLNILLNAFTAGGVGMGTAYVMFPLCSVLYFMMYLYGIWKACNVSFLREAPGYRR